MKALQIIQLIEENNISLLLEIAKTEYEKETAKNNGNAKLLKVVRKLMKKNEKSNPNIHGYTLYNEKYYFTDGTMLLESDSSFGYNEVFKSLDIKGIVRNKYDYDKHATIDKLKLELMVKNNKQHKKSIEMKQFYVINNEIGFDPEKLLDMVDATGSLEIHYINNFSSAYLGENENNFILPVRLKNYN